MLGAQAAPTVGLRVEKPKMTITKPDAAKPQNDYGPSQETKTTTFEFTGKVSCTPPKDQTFTVTLEAYFITCAIGAKGARDELGERKEVGQFTFGGGAPNSQEFKFSSPQIVETTTVTRSGAGRFARVIDKTRTGTRHKGVIIRALDSDKKVLKVVTEPSNMVWQKAAKKDVVSLD
jgi:hypothetical protein